MKKPYVWSGIIGAIFIVVSALALSATFTEPSSLPLVNIAESVSSVFSIFFGAFLVYLYFRGKYTEEQMKEISQPVPDSDEDKKLIRRKQDWVLIIFLLFPLSYSAATWILNDYSAGFTPVNLSVIVDVVASLAFLYFAIELFRGKRDVRYALFATVVVYALLLGALDIWRGYISATVTLPIFAAFVGYTVFAPVSRTNFRIANFVLLPLFIVATMAVSPIDDSTLTELWEDFNAADQQFIVQSNVLDGAYQKFLLKERPTKTEIEDVLHEIDKRNELIANIGSALEKIRVERARAWPSPEVAKSVEGLSFIKRRIDIHSAQGEKLREMMTYALTVNFGRMTEEQQVRLKTFEDEVAEYVTQLTDLDVEYERANLESE